MTSRPRQHSWLREIELDLEEARDAMSRGNAATARAAVDRALHRAGPPEVDQAHAVVLTALALDVVAPAPVAAIGGAR